MSKPEPTPPLGDGPAYLMVNDGPVVRVDAGGFATIPAPESYLFAGWSAPGVAPHVLSLSTRIYAIDGDALRTVASREPSRGCLHAVVRGPADLRLACSDGVHSWDGAAWTSAPGPEGDDLDAVVLPPKGLQIDRAGGLWLASRTAVYRQTPAGWAVVVGADVIREVVGEVIALAQGPDDAIYILGSTGLFEVSTASPRPRPVELGLPSEDVSLTELRVSPRGDIAITGRSAVDDRAALGPEASLPDFDHSDTHLEWFVALRDVDGRRARYTLSAEIQVGLPNALAIDGAGRAWWGSAHGVAILGIDAEPVRWWRGAIPGELPVRDDFDRYNARGGIASVVVVDGGPTLPAVPTMTPTRARGRLVDGRRPLAEVDVEACTTPRHRYRGSPCAHATGRRTARSDEEGRFELGELHPGDHELFARRDDGWRRVHAIISVASVTTPEVVLGDLTVRP